MIPAEFDYEVASSAADAMRLLGQSEDAKLLAGGHSLIPLMKLRLARPTLLVDISRIEALRGVRDAGDHLEIGALTRHADIETSDLVKQHCPILAHTASLVGDRQVRHMGTIGGSCAHGDSASDLPTICQALDAQFVIQGASGERTVAAHDFFKGFFETALAHGEILTAIRVPKTSAGWSYIKFRTRALDWATVGVAALVDRQNGSISGARVAFTNMATIPLRASAVEQALVGAGPDRIAAAAAHAPEGTDPPSDTWATADFRRHLVQVLTRRAVEEAFAR